MANRKGAVAVAAVCSSPIFHIAKLQGRVDFIDQLGVGTAILYA